MDTVESTELVTTISGTKRKANSVQNTTSEDGRADIVTEDEAFTFFKQYPYTYYVPISSPNLVKSMIVWMVKSIICAVLLVVLYPLIIPVYIIVICQFQFSFIKNRNQFFKSGCQRGGFCSFLGKIWELPVFTILTLNALVIAPSFYFAHRFDNNSDVSGSLLIPTVLFFIYRKCFLLRLSRWYLRLRRGSSSSLRKIFPQWFLKYFIKSGLSLHYLLIKEYVTNEIYLRTDRRFKGTFNTGLAEVDVCKFIIPYKIARNFYDKEHYLFRTVVSVAISLVLITPFVFTDDAFNFMIHIVLAMGVFWIMIAIWFEIEGRLVFALLEYLDRMRQFGELLYFDPSQKKDRTKLRTFNVKSKQRKTIESATHCQSVIKLCDGYNANVWIENWLMMYNEVNIYFHKFEYILYSIIVSIISAVFMLIYTFFNGEKVFNTNVAVSGVGCFALLLIWIELLMISFKFYKLEKKHTESLINQKVWIKQTIFELSMNHDNTDRNEIFRLESCVNLINELLQKMKIKGMSPRIAGIQMNDAFVRVTWSLVISVITAAVSYYVKRA